MQLLWEEDLKMHLLNIWEVIEIPTAALFHVTLFFTISRVSYEGRLLDSNHFCQGVHLHFQWLWAAKASFYLACFLSSWYIQLINGLACALKSLKYSTSTKLLCSLHCKKSACVSHESCPFSIAIQFCPNSFFSKSEKYTITCDFFEANWYTQFLGVICPDLTLVHFDFNQPSMNLWAEYPTSQCFILISTLFSLISSC